VISTALPIQPLDCAELIRGRAWRERLTLTGMQLRLLPVSDSTDAQTRRTLTPEQVTLKWQAGSTTKPERLLDWVSTGMDSLCRPRRGSAPQVTCDQGLRTSKSCVNYCFVMCFFLLHSPWAQLNGQELMNRFTW
jgi:hypothetical protein